MQRLTSILHCREVHRTHLYVVYQKKLKNREIYYYVTYTAVLVAMATTDVLTQEMECIDAVAINGEHFRAMGSHVTTWVIRKTRALWTRVLRSRLSAAMTVFIRIYCFILVLLELSFALHFLCGGIVFSLRTQYLACSCWEHRVYFLAMKMHSFRSTSRFILRDAIEVVLSFFLFLFMIQVTLISRKSSIVDLNQCDGVHDLIANNTRCT